MHACIGRAWSGKRRQAGERRLARGGAGGGGRDLNGELLLLCVGAGGGGRRLCTCPPLACLGDGDADDITATTCRLPRRRCVGQPWVAAPQHMPRQLQPCLPRRRRWRGQSFINQAQQRCWRRGRHVLPAAGLPRPLALGAGRTAGHPSDSPLLLRSQGPCMQQGERGTEVGSRVVRVWRLWRRARAPRERQ